MTRHKILFKSLRVVTAFLTAPERGELLTFNEAVTHVMEPSDGPLRSEIAANALRFLHNRRARREEHHA